jgi:hypothetical protein
VNTIIALFFGVGLTLSAIAGMAVFASAALHLLRALAVSLLDSLERTLARTETFEQEISRPRAHWRMS